MSRQANRIHRADPWAQGRGPIGRSLLVSERLACTPVPLDLVPLSLLLLSLPVSLGECCPPLRTYPRVARYQSKARG